MCQVEDPVKVDDGTMCLAQTPVPGPLGLTTSQRSENAPTQLATAWKPERAVQDVSISLGAETTWDSIVREVYNKGALAIRTQAQALVRTGQMTAEEAKVWANGQRNALMQACRDKSSPLGKAIAEAIKPKPKTVADLQKLGKSAAGIIESAGKTNPYVNRVAVGFRYAGPTMLVIGLAFSAYHISTAPANERWQVIIQEAGTWAGALAGGWAGGVSGCEVGGVAGTFIEPGGGTAIGCVVGGLVGTVGGAIAGGWAGSKIGDYVYRASERSY
jgi:hypothetical protein